MDRTNEVFRTKCGYAWHILQARTEGPAGVTEAEALCGRVAQDPKGNAARIINGVPTCTPCIREKAERDRLRQEAQARELDVQGVGA